VHDDIQIVHQDPVPLAQALDPARLDLMLVLAALQNAVVDRLRLTLGVTRADDEVVGVAKHSTQVELHDLHGLLISGVARDLAE